MNASHFEGSEQREEMSQGEALKFQIAEIDAQILSIAGKVGDLPAESHPYVEKYNQEVQKLEVDRAHLVKMLQSLI